MSWFKTALLCLTLAACGFQPVYGPNGTASGLLNTIAVDPPVDREGFFLVRQIEERLGRPADTRYRLAIELSVAQEDRAIDPDGDIRRFHLIAGASYTLIDADTGAVAHSGQVSDFVGYSATGTTVATLAAKRAAQERLMTILADEIVLQLQATQL